MKTPPEPRYTGRRDRHPEFWKRAYLVALEQEPYSNANRIAQIKADTAVKHYEEYLNEAG